MGDILRGECECGFQSKDLYIGGGMYRRWYSEIPTVCRRCGGLEMINRYLRKGGDIKIRRTGLKCRKCKKNKTILNAPTLHSPSGIAKQFGEDYPWELEYLRSKRDDIPEIRYFCPKCKCVKMRLIWRGVWD